ncbi:MAG: cobalamin biosynthesis protein, partial [Deltaproteobacteria bacterium]
RKAALESLAENASDAVVAPLVWFVLLGAPGAAFYRMVNTLDAMWGYRNGRYRHFGWWAARVDDAMNWLPARVTAVLFAIVGRTPDWRALARQAGSHASPNAGWPEAALAFAANVRLGGPVMRGGRIEPRPAYGPGEARDSEQAAAEAVRLVRRMLVLGAVLAMGVTIVR